MHAAAAADTLYFALTGDIVASRDLPDRAEVQRTLHRTLESLNRELSESLAASFKIVAGDEVQGLLFEPEGVVDVVVTIADELHPVAMAWGLGKGPLSTDLARDVSVVDGPCLHRARAAVEVAAADGRWLVADGIDATHDEALSALFHLMGAIRSGWTETQMKYVQEARHRSQTDIAALFDVSRQAVSKSLDAARFAAVGNGEDAARAILRWLGSTP